MKELKGSETAKRPGLWGLGWSVVGERRHVNSRVPKGHEGAKGAVKRFRDWLRRPWLCSLGWRVVGEGIETAYGPLLWGLGRGRDGMYIC